jgi:non-heme chloroperoxidase
MTTGAMAAALAVTLPALAAQSTPAAVPAGSKNDGHASGSGILTVKDGTQIFYKDWGTGQPLVFHHGWPLSSDDWDAQMLFFSGKGFRVIAHDRRGHGRSSQTTVGNEMDTYAADVAQLMAHLDIRNAVHIGHSTGGGEVARYVARQGGADRCRTADHAAHREQSGRPASGRLRWSAQGPDRQPFRILS